MNIRRSCLLALGIGLAPGVSAQLAIEGVGSSLESTLHGQISQLEAPCTLSEARARGVARQAVSDTRETLRAVGYYQAEVTQSLVSTEAGCWQINLQIDTGSATRISAVDIQLRGAARDDNAFSSLAENPPLGVGDQLSHGEYESYKGAFERLALRRGYYDARFTVSQIRVDPDLAEAEIVLHFDSGVRYRYGEFLIDEAGPSIDFVRRFIPFSGGDPVNSTALIELQQRLIDSQYFSVVSVRPQIAQRENGLVDVRIGLQPVKTWHFSVGAGVDTNTGPRASLAVENRLLNPRGDRAGMETSFSPKLKQFELSHRRPLEEPTRELRQWKIGVRSEETDTSRSTRQSIGWSRVRLMDAGWVRTFGLSYNRENSVIGTLDVKSELFLPTVSLQKSSRLGERRITRGWRVNLDLAGAVNNLLSDTSLVQAHMDAKGIMGLGDGRLIGRVELGTTWVDTFAEVPASLRYFAGGDNSLRGYDYKSLGPRDAEGNVVGGRHLAIASLEYDYPIATNWDLAIFADAGDAFNGEPRMNSSLGFGVRWHSLVGTIRIDLAVPSEGGARLHIFMGPEL